MAHGSLVAVEHRSGRSTAPAAAAAACCLVGCLLLSEDATSSLAARNDPPDGLASPENHRLSIEIRDPQGSPIPARVRVFGSDGRVHPDTLDPARLCFLGAGGYFYANGSTWVDVPAGMTRVTVGRGFEWRAWDRTLGIQRDTTLAIVLERFVDLGAEGWYGGDLHVHSQHPPRDYGIPVNRALFIARAEGLSVAHFLDQGFRFIGAPDPISDAETILYYTYEYRNATYGHVSLPGLREPVEEGCCLDPLPAYPMLLDFRHEVVPAKGPMIVLAHPHTTDDYFYDEGWPGSGLGREVPVLAALGALDALDVVSYSNNPYEDWDEWYDLLSAGVAVPPSAGTDAQICAVVSSPMGGWRVYANLRPGASLDYTTWLDALRAGKSFLTNYPLIPEFHVSDAAPGETLEVAEPTLEAQVHVRALCALGLRHVSILAEGNEVWSAYVGPHLPPITEVDTSFVLSIPTPAWLIARVEGQPGSAHAPIGTPLAVTSAIRIVRDGNPILRTEACGRCLDSLDRLRFFVDLRDNWDAIWQRDTVMARIGRAERFYARAFVVPPRPFLLLSPALAETVEIGQLRLEWEPAADTEAGDHVHYVVQVADDSLFSHIHMYRTENTHYEGLLLVPDRWYWWAVDAIDRGENTTRGTPPVSCFFLSRTLACTGTGLASSPPVPHGFPNPSSRCVRLEGFDEAVVILDVTGRRVAGSGDGIRAQGNTLVWDGTIRGRPAPPGLYWARGQRNGAIARLIRVR